MADNNIIVQSPGPQGPSGTSTAGTNLTESPAGVLNVSSTVTGLTSLSTTTLTATGITTMGSNLRLPSVTSDPSSLVDGDIWYRSDTDEVKARVNGATAVIYPVNYANQRTSDTSTINSTTLVTVTTVTLSPGTYYFRAQMGIVGNGTDSTIGFNVQGSAVTSAYRWTATLNNGTAASNAGTASSGTTIPSSTSGVAVSTIGTVTTEGSVVASGIVTVTTTGTLIMALSRTAGSGTYVGKTGSVMMVNRV